MPLATLAPPPPAAPEGSPVATLAGTERTSEPPRLHVGRRLRELVAARETLVNLIRKELKVKYTASVLGAVWSLLNPVVFLAVFSFVVDVLNNNITDFPVFLLSGLLAWNFFSASLLTGSRSVIEHANLVKKVAFPREILPLSAVGVALFDLILQSAVLWVFIVVSGHGLVLPELALYPLAFLVLLVFTTGATLWVSALNVRYRDVGHLLNLGLLVWFWLTPIVYQGHLVQQALTGESFLGLDKWTLYVLNPMTMIVFGFQRALYGFVTPPGDTEAVLPTVGLDWHLATLGALLLFSTVLLLLGWRSFFHRSGDFAEEL
jgi:ABC-2 type transport system permease protein